MMKKFQTNSLLEKTKLDNFSIEDHLWCFFFLDEVHHDMDFLQSKFILKAKYATPWSK